MAIQRWLDNFAVGKSHIIRGSVLNLEEGGRRRRKNAGCHQIDGRLEICLRSRQRLDPYCEEGCYVLTYTSHRTESAWRIQLRKGQFTTLKHRMLLWNAWDMIEKEGYIELEFVSLIRRRCRGCRRFSRCFSRCPSPETNIKRFGHTNTWASRWIEHPIDRPCRSGPFCVTHIMAGNV